MKHDINKIKELCTELYRTITGNKKITDSQLRKMIRCNLNFFIGFKDPTWLRKEELEDFEELLSARLKGERNKRSFPSFKE